MHRIITNLPFESWLNEYGNVFKVIDDHDSGNISYGITTLEQRKCFVKFAPYSNEEACRLINNAREIALRIKHPVLIEFKFTVECSNGIAIVYRWVDAESINEVTNTSKANSRVIREHPSSPYSRLKALPISKILTVLNKIFHLHLKIEDENYVSCDWYDGCLMYNFNVDKLYVMDLDTYHKGSFTNTMGRMYGSSRFMAPEEFELGAFIDNRTMVYHMGATVFEFLGEGKKNLNEGFRGTKEQYNIALKAISKNKEDRYQSVHEFYYDWVNTLQMKK